MWLLIDISNQSDDKEDWDPYGEYQYNEPKAEGPTTTMSPYLHGPGAQILSNVLNRPYNFG